jgi:hypothetical protein
MTGKISALIAVAVILGSASVASAAVRQKPGQTGLYTPAVATYGGYSSDPHTRALERLADKYNGWAEYVQ